MKQSLHGSHRHREHRSNLFVRLLLHIKQDDYLSLLEGELINETSQCVTIDSGLIRRDGFRHVYR